MFINTRNLGLLVESYAEQTVKQLIVEATLQRVDFLLGKFDVTPTALVEPPERR